MPPGCFRQYTWWQTPSAQASTTSLSTLIARLPKGGCGLAESLLPALRQSAVINVAVVSHVAAHRSYLVRPHIAPWQLQHSSLARLFSPHEAAQQLAEITYSKLLPLH
jgi:hypothetical protein